MMRLVPDPGPRPGLAQADPAQPGPAQADGGQHDVTWVRLSLVRAAGTGPWRPGCHFLPGRPGAGPGSGRPRP